jgi:hypothetical protein
VTSDVYRVGLRRDLHREARGYEVVDGLGHRRGPGSPSIVGEPGAVVDEVKSPVTAKRVSAVSPYCNKGILGD